MPTFIKTGYWEKTQKGYNGWLNLDSVVNSSVFNILTINTSGQSTTISNFYPAGTDGQNVYIGGGGLLGSGTAGESSYNVSLGVNALKNQTTGSYNIALGWEAGRDLSTGGENILIGWQSGLVITTGFQNIFIGGAVGDAMTTGYRNTIIGNAAFSANTNGLHNVAFGRNAMRFGTTGSENVAIGNDALSNVTGNKNTALGYQAGTSVVTNTNSVFLGPNSQPSANGNTNELVIGYNAVGNGSNTTVIGNSSTVSTRLYGSLGIGTNSPAGPLDVVSDGGGQMFFSRYGGQPQINIRRAQGTFAVPTAVVSGASSVFNFQNYNGTAFQTSAQIQSVPTTQSATDAGATLALNVVQGLTTTMTTGLIVSGNNATAGAISITNAFNGPSARLTIWQSTLNTTLDYFDIVSSGGGQLLRFFNNGNLVIGGNANSTFKLDVAGTIRGTQYNLSALNTAPASATATGTLGEIRIDANHIYVCTATNTWKRVAIATW